MAAGLGRCSLSLLQSGRHLVLMYRHVTSISAGAGLWHGCDSSEYNHTMFYVLSDAQAIFLIYIFVLSRMHKLKMQGSLYGKNDA